MWPEGRERVVMGRLELFRPTTQEENGDPVMMHDPTVVTDGIGGLAGRPDHRGAARRVSRVGGAAYRQMAASNARRSFAECCT
jgi:hypothetical protein